MRTRFDFLFISTAVALMLLTPWLVIAELPKEKNENVEALTKALGSGERSQRIDAAKKLAGVHGLPESTTKALLEMAKFELIAAIAPRAFPKNLKPVTKLPLDGNEISLDRIKANPQDYVGKNFTLCGGVEVSTFFGDFDGEKYYSFYFTPFDENVEHAGSETAYVFLLREVGAGLVEYMTQAKEAGFDVVIVNLRVSIAPERYDGVDSWNSIMEITDWRTLDVTQKEWRPWAFGGANAAFEAVYQSGRTGVIALVDLLAEPPAGNELIEGGMRIMAVRAFGVNGQEKSSPRQDATTASKAAGEGRGSEKVDRRGGINGAGEHEVGDGAEEVSQCQPDSGNTVQG